MGVGSEWLTLLAPMHCLLNNPRCAHHGAHQKKIAPLVNLISEPIVSEMTSSTRYMYTPISARSVRLFCVPGHRPNEFLYPCYFAMTRLAHLLASILVEIKSAC